MWLFMYIDFVALSFNCLSRLILFDVGHISDVYYDVFDSRCFYDDFDNFRTLPWQHASLLRKTEFMSNNVLFNIFNSVKCLETSFACRMINNATQNTLGLF